MSGLPDMYTPRAEGVNIRQTTHAHFSLGLGLDLYAHNLEEDNSTVIG